MDYIKAYNLLKSASNKLEVYNWIYQITRLYIPNLIFKYYSLNEDTNLNDLKQKTLQGKKIYLSESNELMQD
jgi:hypothetical protein